MAIDETADMFEALERTARTILACRTVIPSLDRAAILLTASIRDNGTIFWCGNGGSAADSQHLAAELIGRFGMNRDPLRSIAITVDTSVLTAVGNDFGFEEVFARQVRGLGRPGDVLVGISTSGKSANVLSALRTARTSGLRTIGFCGAFVDSFDQVCDVVVSVPSRITSDIQTAHIALGQMLCERLEREFFA